jgi:curved DNA-binding protein CbpA
MTDHFALLEQPRRPWLEPGQLKEKFLSLSATAHPDRVHNAAPEQRQSAHDHYTALNAAYQCLREPKDRLRHLLQLEGNAGPAQVQRVPAGLMELSLSVGQLCRLADAVLEEKRATVSPLLQVQIFERAQACAEQLGQMQAQLRARQAACETDLKQLDARWEADVREPAHRDHALHQLEELAALLSYFARWQNQLQERVVQLSF